MQAAGFSIRISQDVYGIASERAGENKEQHAGENVESHGSNVAKAPPFEIVTRQLARVEQQRSERAHEARIQVEYVFQQVAQQGRKKAHQVLVGLAAVIAKRPLEFRAAIEAGRRIGQFSRGQCIAPVWNHQGLCSSRAADFLFALAHEFMMPAFHSQSMVSCSRGRMGVER